MLFLAVAAFILNVALTRAWLFSGRRLPASRRWLHERGARVALPQVGLLIAALGAALGTGAGAWLAAR